MRKLITALIPCILFAAGAPAHAQDSWAGVRKGGEALVFTLSGLSNLGPQEAGSGDSLGVAGGVGMKFWLTDRLAVRGILGFTLNSQTDKATVAQQSDEKTTITGITVMPGIQFNMVKVGQGFGYVGGQLAFVYIKYNVDNTNKVPGFNIESSGTGFGVGGFMGIEYFLWESVSLSAEYQLMFATTSGKDKQTVPGTASTESDRPSETMITLKSGSSAALTLSMYF